jgi:hypothetical protein
MRRKLLRNLLAYFLLPIFFAYLASNKFAPTSTNADTVIFSLMSIQKPTLLAWGQDRLFILAPIIFQFLKDPVLNLQAQILFYGWTYFVFLAYSCFIGLKVRQSKVAFVDQVLCYLIASLLSLFFMGPVMNHVFISEGQPYALSYLLTLMAVVLIVQKREQRLSKLLAFVLIFISTGLNPSILLLTGALGFGISVYEKRLRSAWLIGAAILSFYVWGRLGAIYGTPGGNYSGFIFKNFVSNLESAWSFIYYYSRIHLIMYLFPLMIILMILYRSTIQPRFFFASLLLIGYALGWLLIFSQNSWIIANGYHFRYFFPTVVLPIILLGIVLQKTIQELKHHWKYLSGFGLTTAFVFWTYDPYTPIDKYKVFLEEPVQSKSEYAKAHGIRLISGNYWEVWPIVWRLKSQGIDAYGISFRSRAIADLITQKVKDDFHTLDSTRALCVDQLPDDCLKMSLEYTGHQWEAKDWNASVSFNTIQLSQQKRNLLETY